MLMCLLVFDRYKAARLLFIRRSFKRSCLTELYSWQETVNGILSGGTKSIAHGKPPLRKTMVGQTATSSKRHMTITRQLGGPDQNLIDPTGKKAATF